MSAAAVPFESRPSDSLLRFAIALLCVPSGAALLLKAYGMMEVRPVVLAAGIPSLLLLAVLAWRGSADVRSDMLIGGVAGLIGTVAYDIVRIPAEVVGYRVYGTISVFGLWLLDAEKSTRFTELAGWSYNYINGICFGMIYAVLMRGRHWIFGVAWAMVLESLAVFTPLGRIFAVRGNTTLLLVAYTAHIAYGLPLGKAVQNWHDTRSALQEMPIAARWTVLVIATLVLLHPFLSPDAAAADSRATAARFRVEGIALNPDWLRIRRDQSISLANPSDQPATVTIKDLGKSYDVGAGKSVATLPLLPGIHQFFVETPGRTHSSFVVVEPVEVPDK